MATGKPTFGVLLPTRGVILQARDVPDLSPIFDLAQAAEDTGYDSVWVGDSVLAKSRLDALTTMGLSPLESGLWTLPWAIAFVVGSNLTPVIVRRVRPAFVMAAGLALAAVGFGMFTQVDAASGFTVFVTGSVAFALGFSPVFTLTNDLLVGSAPPERAGAAAAVAETAAEVSAIYHPVGIAWLVKSADRPGRALGINGVFGSLGIAVYRSMMAGEVPAGVPVEAAQAVMDTLGGAVVIAGQLPDQLGAALVAAARGAFIQGLQVSAAISAVGALGIAILVVVLLRQVGGSVPSEAHSDLATAAQTATDG